MNRFKTVLALSAAILFIPTKALAEWIYVSPGTSGERVEIETDSVEYQSPKVFYLLPSIENAPDYTGVSKSTIYASINCSSKTSRIYRMTGFNKSGRIVFDYDKTSDSSRILPGGPTSKIYQQLCP